jgi:hypothetical protein
MAPESVPKSETKRRTHQATLDEYVEQMTDYLEKRSWEYDYAAKEDEYDVRAALMRPIVPHEPVPHDRRNCPYCGTRSEARE